MRPEGIGRSNERVGTVRRGPSIRSRLGKPESSSRVRGAVDHNGSVIRPGQVVLLAATALLVVGVVMSTSAGLAVDRELGVLGVLTGRPVILGLLALAGMTAGALLPVDRWLEVRGARDLLPWLVLGCVLAVALVQIPGVGEVRNGARRWVEVAGVGFQPSELTKWGLILALAAWCTRRPGAMGRFAEGVLPPLVVIGACTALIALDDLGTALLVGMVAVIMLVAGGMRLAHAGLLAAIGLAGAVAAVIARPYRLRRLETFFAPTDDPSDAGYHVVQSLNAISESGTWGRGLGHGLRKFEYLPEDETDFVFSIVCEELGMAGALLVAVLVAAVVLGGLSVVRRTSSPLAALAALGTSLTFAGQAAINLLVVTGLAPTKGIALPLVSAGGTGWCLTAFCLGLLERIDRRAEADLIATRPGIDADAIDPPTADVRSDPTGTGLAPAAG